MAQSENPSPLTILRSEFRRNRRIKFIDIKPPIESEIRDADEIKLSFDKFPIIPYSGSSEATSDNLVNMLNNLINVSSTFAGVVEGTKIYGLKGKIQIVKTEDEFETKEAKVSESEANEFKNTVKSLQFSNSILETACLLSQDEDSVGMFGVEVVYVKSLGIPQITIKHILTTDFKFKNNKEKGTEVFVSHRWDYEYLKNNPARLLPVYPLVYDFPDGTSRTFFYHKNGGLLYGRPMDLGAIFDKYSEYKLKQYLNKKLKKQFLPDVLIEYEDGNMSGGLLDDDAAKAAGFGSASDRFQNSFTNEGEDPVNVMIQTRPAGASPALVHEFGGIKNIKDIQTLLEICEANILKANNWSKMLLYLDGQTGFSANEFFDAFEIQSVTKINERQEMLEKFFNKIIHYAFKRLGKETDLGIKFTSPISALKKEREENDTERLRGNKTQSSVKPTKGQN